MHLKRFAFCLFFACFVYCFITGSKDKFIPIAKDGFLANFICPNDSVINDVRCLLVLPWYLPYINSTHFFAKAFSNTKNEQQRNDIYFLASTNDVKMQTLCVKQVNQNNIYLRLYKKYYPINRYLIGLRSIDLEKVRKGDKGLMFFPFFLFLSWCILLHFLFKDSMYGIILLAAPFVSLRLLLIVASGISWSRILLKTEKFHLKHLIVCPYVVLSSASVVFLILYVLLSKLSCKEKVLLSFLLVLSCSEKLVMNNRIVNNRIVNNRIVNNSIVNNSIVNKVIYFVSKSALFRDFSRQNYTRGLTVWFLFIFTLIILVKKPNVFLVVSAFSFLLEGMVLFFSLMFTLRLCFLK